MVVFIHCSPASVNAMHSLYSELQFPDRTGRSIKIRIPISIHKLTNTNNDRVRGRDALETSYHCSRETIKTAYGVFETNCLGAHSICSIMAWTECANTKSSEVVVEQLNKTRLAWNISCQSDSYYHRQDGKRRTKDSSFPFSFSLSPCALFRISR